MHALVCGFSQFPNFPQNLLERGTMHQWLWVNHQDYSCWCKKWLVIMRFQGVKTFLLRFIITFVSAGAFAKFEARLLMQNRNYAIWQLHLYKFSVETILNQIRHFFSSGQHDVGTHGIISTFMQKSSEVFSKQVKKLQIMLLFKKHHFLVLCALSYMPLINWLMEWISSTFMQGSS